MSKYLILIFTTLIVFTSCDEVVKEAITNWTNSEEYVLDGKYNLIERDYTQVFLPNEFIKITLNDYRRLVDTLKNKEEVIEKDIKNLNLLKTQAKSFQMYRDTLTHGILTVARIPHINFSKKDAGYLLGYIRQEFDSKSEEQGLLYEKITARYMEKNKTKIFKSVFRVTDQKTGLQYYKSSYILTKENNTVMFNLATGFEAYFDSYVINTKFY